MSKIKKIAILGTRGIPNLYGGFEQFAEYVSVGLAEIGHEVIVYSPTFHPYKEPTFNGVYIIRKWCPEGKIGASAHILYDYLCLMDAIRRKVDVVLELGYQSSAISMLLCPIWKTRLITNMDGMEWKREKWSPLVQRFTRWAERTSVLKSDALVADNQGIKDYIRETYGKDSAMIPYGAEIFNKPDISILGKYDLTANEYFILIARMEPENNVEIVLDGYIQSGATLPFIVVGNYSHDYGARMRKKFDCSNVHFVGGIYDINALNNLRFYARIYLHGHSVGGTNPSLLEAMASQALIVAHDNIFNRSVLGDDALYFCTSQEVAGIFNNQALIETKKLKYIEANLCKIRKIYNWDRIIQQYASLIGKVSA
jgi:glycosyltransferase involved in cell wall biosynthesis